MTRDSMVEFMKLLKRTTNVSDQEASLLAATKIHESMPKSRMYYKIGASRNIGGGKKIDPRSNMPEKLKKIMKDVNSGVPRKLKEVEEDLAIIGV